MNEEISQSDYKWWWLWLGLNPYTGKWGVKWPPSPLLPLYLLNCKIYCHALFGHVQDSEGYLLLYKVLSHLYRKCGHDGVKPEVHFRKLAKVVSPTVNLTITSNRHYHRLLSYFHGHLAWICCWHSFLMSIFIAICDPENMCLVFGNLQIYFLCEVITTPVSSVTVAPS